ncbi:MAG: adenine phosphoribosyltransferase [Pseudobutyrivibrio sp.]|nr:adenine phosphoribosyltransferase [Pseudobutyrivibrio sp.]
MKTVEDYIKSIPDFPEPGVIFRDVTSLIKEPEGFKLAIDELIKLLDGVDFDVIAAAESRGFVFAAPLAYALGKPLVLIRKAGKLPRETVSTSYELEYGKATIEVHKDDLLPGQKVVLMDDILATGGTIEASIRLVEELGAEVAKILILMELAGFNGRERLAKYDLNSVIVYEGK